MKPPAPRRIEIHIGRIELRGFSPAHHAALSKDLSAELTRLLSQPESAGALAQSRVSPGTNLRGNLQATTPGGLVRGLASSIVRGITR